MADKNWGLFHYHMDTHEMIAFSNQKPMYESEAKSEAEGLRVGVGRGSAYRSRWTVVAAKLPEEKKDA